MAPHTSTASQSPLPVTVAADQQTHDSLYFCTKPLPVTVAANQQLHDSSHFCTVPLPAVQGHAHNQQDMYNMNRLVSTNVVTLSPHICLMRQRQHPYAKPLKKAPTSTPQAQVFYEMVPHELALPCRSNVRALSLLMRLKAAIITQTQNQTIPNLDILEKRIHAHSPKHKK
eukprot:1138016-Pelagomonas_calceolata.AAC.4